MECLPLFSTIEGKSDGFREKTTWYTKGRHESTVNVPIYRIKSQEIN